MEFNNFFSQAIVRFLRVELQTDLSKAQALFALQTVKRRTTYFFSSLGIVHKFVARERTLAIIEGIH